MVLNSSWNQAPEKAPGLRPSPSRLKIVINKRWRGVKAERRWAAVFFWVLIRKEKKKIEENGKRDVFPRTESCISDDIQGVVYAPYVLHWETVTSCDPKPHKGLLPPWPEPFCRSLTQMDIPNSANGTLVLLMITETGTPGFFHTVLMTLKRTQPGGCIWHIPTQ